MDGVWIIVFIVLGFLLVGALIRWIVDPEGANRSMDATRGDIYDKTGPLQQGLSELRAEVADLKRDVSEIKQQLKALTGEGKV